MDLPTVPKELLPEDDGKCLCANCLKILLNGGSRGAEEG